MKRMLVRPEALQQLSGEFRQVARSLRDLTGGLVGGLTRLDWEVRQQTAVDLHMARAGSVGSGLVDQAEEMAALLTWKAELFRSTDDAPLPEGVAVARGWELLGGTPDVAPLGAVPDLFWAGVGGAPVLVEDGVARFSPGFAGWAGQFNARLETLWAQRGTDHAGTVGADDLMAVYALTPEKAERIWSFSEEHHVDPRLMLAILQQEGTGSFNTNPANRAAYGGGHGPQPDFERDLAGALEGTVLSKLRLYPLAVKAGFSGSWVEWVNWHTPMDRPWKPGESGVYAEDIQWNVGVERHYLQISRATGSEQENPVQAYADWMNQNSERFQPRHIAGEFEIRPGRAPGTDAQSMALWGGLPRPDYPGTSATPESGFWRFPAPEEFCWHLVRK